MFTNQQDFYSYYRALQENIRAEILRETEEQIIGSNPEELVQYYYDKKALIPIEEDPKREISWDLEKYLRNISPHERESFYSSEGVLRDFECERVVVEIPLIKNNQIQLLVSLMASTSTMGYSERDLDWKEEKVFINIATKGYGFDYSAEVIEKKINEAISRVRQLIEWKNSDIKKGNVELLSFITQLVKERRDKIQNDKSKIEALTKKINIPLKKKPPALATKINISQTPLVQRIKPKATVLEEYVLDENKISDIITFLDNQAKSYERTPSAVKSLGEEDLRDLLLANLNSVFEGNATGETFSKKGKTDIYLKIDKGNILICECKIWGGKSLYDKTIDQLRGYLTWRHNYGIMITFSRNKEFTKILTESESAIKNHASYISGFKKVSDTHFVSNNRVDDELKEVKIHHLFYNLFSE